MGWYNRQNSNTKDDKRHGQPKLDGAILVQLLEYKTVPVKKKDTSKDEGKSGTDGKKDKQNDEKKKNSDNDKKIAKITTKKTKRRTATLRNLGDGDCMRIGSSIASTKMTNIRIKRWKRSSQGKRGPN